MFGGILMPFSNTTRLQRPDFAVNVASRSKDPAVSFGKKLGFDRQHLCRNDEHSEVGPGNARQPSRYICNWLNVRSHFTTQKRL